jgi:hypothetical protein
VTIQKYIDPLEAIIAQIQEDAIPKHWEVIHQLQSFPSAEEMAFRNGKQIRLRAPTITTRNGLTFQKDDGRLVVEYDYESAWARVERMRVAFFDMLALAYREKAFELAGEPRGAKDVRCVARSRWLSDVVSSWQKPLGLDNGEFAARLSRAFKHYTVFSIGGRVDVIAASCRIVS